MTFIEDNRKGRNRRAYDIHIIDFNECSTMHVLGDDEYKLLPMLSSLDPQRNPLSFQTLTVRCNTSLFRGLT